MNKRNLEKAFSFNKLYGWWRADFYRRSQIETLYKMRIFFAVFATVLAAFGYRSTAQVKSQVETCLMPVKGLWFCQKLEKLKTLDFRVEPKIGL